MTSFSTMGAGGESGCAHGSQLLRNPEGVLLEAMNETLNVVKIARREVDVSVLQEAI